MKHFLAEFLKRGLFAASGGPVILAIIYGILGKTNTIENLTTHEVCIGILTITLMAFIAGGITTIYQTERLPLIFTILIHAAVLYLDYLIMYLLNNWINRSLEAICLFTIIFSIGFALVWCIIYISIKAKTKRINQQLGVRKN